MARSTRSTARGLSDMGKVPNGTVIGFACAPGATAQDGAGAHGVYTKHILEHLERPGVPLLSVMNEIGKGVKRETGGAQVRHRRHPSSSIVIRRHPSTRERGGGWYTPPTVTDPGRFLLGWGVVMDADSTFRTVVVVLPSPYLVARCRT